MHTRIRRMLIAASIVVILGSTLSGCVPVSELVPHSFGATGQPAVGDCWQSTYQQAENDGAWKASAPLPCALKHQLYTYAVVTIRSSDNSWKTSTGATKPSLSRAISAHCEKHYKRLFPHVLSTQSRLHSLQFIAPDTQWRQGARWARCDIAVTKSGTLVKKPRLADLPPDIGYLVAQVAREPQLFGDCVTIGDSAEAGDPLNAASAKIADCTRHPQWILHSFVPLAGTSTDPYPGDEAVDRAVAVACDAEASRTGNTSMTYYPTEQGWSAGLRSGSCWFRGDT